MRSLLRELEMAKKQSKAAVDIAEESVISGIFSVGYDPIADNLTGSDFSSSALGATLDAAKSIYLSGHNPTIELTVIEGEKGPIPLDAATIKAIVERYDSISKDDLHRTSLEVLAFSRRRKIENICKEAVLSARAGKLSPEDIADALQGSLLSVSSGGDEPVDFREAAVQAVDDAIAAMDGHSKNLSTGFKQLDALILGLVDSELLVVGARPGMGKTSFAMDLVEAVYSQGAGTFIVSAEMSAVQLAQRRLASRTGIRVNDIRKGKLSREQVALITGESQSMLAERILIDDKPFHGIEAIRSKARRTKSKLDARKTKLGLVIVDYCQLVAGSGVNREQQVSAVSRGCKLMAMELNVPVVLLSQLNRSVEAGTDKRPELYHLRESGSMEQDANAVIMLYREGMNHPTRPDNDAEFIVRKNRSGETGTVNVGWDGKCTRFIDL